jgi:formylglycine-generating enzyme
LALLAALSIPLTGVNIVSANITIATVPVGNPGNAPDPSTGFGEVDYTYNIGEYDVTSTQYTAFLNAVAKTDPYDIYNPAMAAGTIDGLPGIRRSGSSGSYTYSVAAGRGNYPVTEVTFWDACRFANWLDNGQPTGPEGLGTTETGAYTLTPTAISDNTVTRNPGAIWAVTSEDEWYKAAYYSPIYGDTPGYWEYPTQNNTISTTQANYDEVVGNTTTVGSYPYPSYYGTYDQGGEVWEMNESIFVYNNGSFRRCRGGAFDSFNYDLASDNDDYISPSGASNDVGFRVVEVPEPGSLAILAVGGLGLLLRSRKKSV